VGVQSLAAECTIVYADLGLSVPQCPSVVAQTIAQHAKDSLAASQFRVLSRPLSAADVHDAIRAMPSGHDRLSLDTDLILLDAGAMLAYAPYRARVLLTGDPFACAEGLAQLLEVDANAIRIRLHDALLSAEKIVTTAASAYDAIAPLISRKPDDRTFPPIALRAAATEQSPILVVNNDDESSWQDVLPMLTEAFPSQEFHAFDPTAAFDGPWRAVLHLGIARSSLSGARLNDAWAGNVPVVQLVNHASLIAQHRRNPGSLLEMVVEHGRTGLLFSSIDELVNALNDLLLDPLPLRSVARGARRRVDPSAQWNSLLKALLQ
jgi:hypothetical protein